LNPTCAITITTHNRREDLSRTLEVLARLDPPADEILVAVDGCTDGTLEWLRSRHPEVRLLVHERALGSIPSRNELAAACTSDIFVSLDDDSYPIDTDFIARVAELFEKHPRFAVVSFAQRSDEFPESLTAADFGPPQFVASFANSAAAVRRSVFEELGGYPDFFFHFYEEPDFALRCVAAGWQVWQEPTLLVRHHFSSAQRNEMRNHQRHARNEFWSVLLRCPAPQLLAVALFRILRQFGYAWRRGWDWAIREPTWWLAAARGIPRCLRSRRPVLWARYRAWMGLVRTPLISPADWEEKFGPGHS
jgi:GT2 family glycosyltransferase